MEWTSEAVAAFGSREVRLRTRDLSVGGCCVETTLRPPIGERLGLVLHVDGTPVGTWAEVAWSAAHSGHDYVWGLRFVELEHDTAVKLAAYVDHCFAVEMLDEMLRGESSPVAPAFAAGDLDEVPTRIHRGMPTAAVGPEFFPMDGGPAIESEATSEIDVESTLTSEVPHTHTVQVDMAELYRRMAHGGAPLPTATLAAGWDMGPEPVAVGWDEPQASPDPFWGGAPEFPSHAPIAWPSAEAPAPAIEPVIEPLFEENAFAKAVPFDAPPQQYAAPQQYVPQPQQYVPQPQQYYQPHPQYHEPRHYEPQVHDPSAFDPSAFEPQSLAAAPLEIALEPLPTETPAQAPALTVELAPMSPADLLELKRKRIEEMLSSVPRRQSAPESASKGNAGKSDVPTDKHKRVRTGSHPDTGLRQLFDQALRELGRDES